MKSIIEDSDYIANSFYLKERILPLKHNFFNYAGSSENNFASYIEAVIEKGTEIYLHYTITLQIAKRLAKIRVLV